MAWFSAALRPCRALVAVSFAAAVLQLASPALAAGSKLAALVPQIHPATSPELQNRFHEAVSRGLTGPDADLIPAAEVRLRSTNGTVVEDVATCGGSGVCALHAAAALHVDRVVATDVTISGKDYTIHLIMADAAGREIARAEEPCDICTLKEADEAAARAAARLMLTARSNPMVAPTTPPPVEPPPLKPIEPTPPVSAQPATTTTPPAEPVPPSAMAAPVKEKKSFPWRGMAIGSLVVGVVGIAIGAPLLAIDGQPTCNSPNPKTSCPNLWNTAGGGAALVTLGVLGVAAGTALFVVDYTVRHRTTRVTVAPTLGGAMLTSQWRF